MPFESDDALEDWVSLFSEETSSIWNTENRELCKVSMLIQALKQEFKRVEINLDNKVRDLRSQITTNKHSNKCIEGPIATATSKIEKPDLSKSPKLNKHRKGLQLKKLNNSRSLFKVNRIENKLNIPTGLKSKQNNEDLFESSTPNTTLEQSFDSSFDFGQDLKKNNEVVDSSFLIQQTPQRSSKKKIRLDKKFSSKETSALKTQNSNTLTQMFSLASSKDEKSIIKQEKSVSKLSLTLKEETFVPRKSASFVKDYNRIPVVKDEQPQHVYKTETVRRKVERMKLPGWSCYECEKYYKGLELPPEELRKKMNICSKHRNKFPPSNDTIAGFWDVEIPDTQETEDDDLTVISFELASK